MCAALVFPQFPYPSRFALVPFTPHACHAGSPRSRPHTLPTLERASFHPWRCAKCAVILQQKHAQASGAMIETRTCGEGDADTSSVDDTEACGATEVAMDWGGVAERTRTVFAARLVGTLFHWSLVGSLVFTALFWLLGLYPLGFHGLVFAPLSGNCIVIHSINTPVMECIIMQVGESSATRSNHSRCPWTTYVFDIMRFLSCTWHFGLCPRAVQFPSCLFEMVCPGRAAVPRVVSGILIRACPAPSLETVPYLHLCPGRVRSEHALRVPLWVFAPALPTLEITHPRGCSTRPCCVKGMRFAPLSSSRVSNVGILRGQARCAPLSSIPQRVLASPFLKVARRCRSLHRAERSQPMRD